MDSSNLFLSGIVEGFYGREWSDEARLAYAGYLSDLGLNAALYCPKSDATLRRCWQESWEPRRWRQMQRIASAYAAQDVLWGVGLSPFNLYANYGVPERDALHRKVDDLARLNAPMMAILFDDMPGDIDGLAQRQAQIIDDVRAWLPQTRLLACPTYYSFDPVLERHFGQMPPSYWAELGALWPADVEIFWTGNEVCSEKIAALDVQRINDLIGRKVALWDNYPVNDGAKRSRFLYTTPLQHRDPQLKSLLRGHFCNPMNQPLLSLPALTGLAALYGSEAGTNQWLASTLGDEAWALLTRDASLFEHSGLDALDEGACAALAEQYAVAPGAAAVEVRDWLRGCYAFDPECLTD